MNALRLYARYVGLSWRAQLQYRASFALQTLGTALLSVVDFLAIWVLFDRFKRIAGWSLAEVAVFYGTANIAWSLAEGIGRGFDDFGSVVKRGDFDRLLLRPRSTVLQLLGREFTLRRIGRIGQGAAVLAWGWRSLGLGWDAARLGLWLLAVAGGVALFEGILILQATLAFWTIESLEVMNTLTYGGVQTVQYPLAIYPGWLRRFFLLVVPLGCVAYFPVVRLLGRTDPLGAPAWLGWAGPFAGFLFLGVALRAWRFGIRHYTSTGS
ncbi:MAG TPA: ABC-2 family transporter protein [Polyangia bacterium]|nr:ABC-2 family transporter protein [Polyangia bacterium]